MSTHNICFCGEIRKILFLTLLVSRALQVMEFLPYNMGYGEDAFIKPIKRDLLSTKWSLDVNTYKSS